MATLQENGTFDALVDKYISKNEDAQLPELKTVENPKGALVMGTNCEFEPFEYLDENGDPTGFDVGFAQYLCAEMGYTLTIENMDFDALIPALQSGRIDFIAAGLTRDEGGRRTPTSPTATTRPSSPSWSPSPPRNLQHKPVKRESLRRPVRSRLSCATRTFQF